jgi:hypothetical protein
MKIYSAVVSFILVSCLIISCNRKASEQKPVVTERIQYDVTIKSPDPDFDWWMQNIEGSGREKLVNDIIANVREGKVKAYEVLSNKLLTKEDVGHMLRRVDSIAFENPDPPHNLVDTVIVYELQQKDITRIRFLEEWRVDPNDLSFTKNVLGICPVIEAYSESGELKGYKPLFWVYFDERYPGAFNPGKK